MRIVEIDLGRLRVRTMLTVQDKPTSLELAGTGDSRLFGLTWAFTDSSVTMLLQFDFTATSVRRRMDVSAVGELENLDFAFWGNDIYTFNRIPVSSSALPSDARGEA